MRSKSIPLALYTLLTLVGWTTAQTVELVRIVVVDNSGSMKGDRIETVRNEWVNLCRQLEPSDEYPLVLVRFGSTAKTERVCRSQTEADKALSLINAHSWGTNIASGLLQTHSEIENWSAAKNVVVLLYTDGDDSNRAGIAAAERKLDAIFGKRGKEGLRQTVMVKRWNSTNSVMLQKLANSKHVRVIEAGKLDVRTVVITPEARVKSVTWTNAKQTNLRLTLGIRAKAKMSVRSTAEFVCQAKGATGKLKTSVGIGATEAEMVFNVPVSQNQQDSISVPLSISVSNKITKHDGGIVLPVLSQSTVDVRVGLPFEKFDLNMTVGIEMKSTGKWFDVHNLIVEYPIEIVFTVKGGMPSERQRGSVFRIDAKKSCKIIKGHTQISIPGAGEYRLPLTIRSRPTNTGANVEDLRYNIELYSTATKAPPLVRWTPRQLEIAQDHLAAPDRLITTISGKLTKATQTKWFDVKKRVVYLDATVEIAANGILPKSGMVELQPLGNVSEQSIKEVAIQEIRSNFRLKMALVPTKTKQLIVELAPKRDPSSPISLLMKEPIRIEYKTPPNPALVNIKNGRVANNIDVRVSDDVTAADVLIHPAVTEIYSKNSAAGITALITGEDLQPQAMNLFRDHTLRLPLPPEKPTFFRDQQINKKLILKSKEGLATEACLNINITRLAPIKRLLMYASIALGSLLCVVLVVRLFAKLKDPIA